MTLTQMATTPEIILTLISGLLAVALFIAKMIWSLSKALVPVFLKWQADFDSYCAEADGRFEILDMRINENGEKIECLGKRLDHVETNLTQEKYLGELKKRTGQEEG